MVNDLKSSLDCPSELAVSKPAIATAIVDKYDFKSDTLTGAGQSHRTNVTFVQPEAFDTEIPSQDNEDRPVPSANFASNLSTTIKELGSEMQSVKMANSVHLDFRGQGVTKTLKQPFQSVCHVIINGK